MDLLNKQKQQKHSKDAWNEKKNNPLFTFHIPLNVSKLIIISHCYKSFVL